MKKIILAAAFAAFAVPAFAQMMPEDAGVNNFVNGRPISQPEQSFQSPMGIDRSTTASIGETSIDAPKTEGGYSANVSDSDLRR